MRRLRVLAVLLFLFAATTAESCDTSSSGGDNLEQGSASPSDEESVDQEPKGDTNLTCDYVLGDFGESGNPAKGFRFIGGGTITNTGEVGIRVQVTFTFKQLGAAPIRETKVYKVKPGRTKDVNVTIPATQDQIDLHQSADETGDACKAKGKIIGTT